MASIEELAERVERLLLRHGELQRTHELTYLQLTAVTAERDSLKSRLSAARQRIDALLDRLPLVEPSLEPVVPESAAEAVTGSAPGAFDSSTEAR
jgi:hypothetical protein